MKRVSLLLITLLGCICLNAQQRSESEAIQIAQEFFGKKGKTPQLSVVPHQKVDAQIRKRVAAQNTPAQSQGFYVVNDEANNCFVIVSADERMYEVLGYSGNGSFSVEDAPDGLLFMLDEYNRQYEIVNALGGGVSVSPNDSKNVNPIEPLLSTRWYQKDPYWLQCAQYGGDYCVTGCVATAMAQVMAYHRYPENGQGGSLSYKSRTLGISQYMNFDSQHFDWNTIQNTYIYYYDEEGVRHSVPERSIEENNEVAKLMHACGVSVFMDYNISANGGSGAYPSDIPYALIHYFGYNPNIYYAGKDYYTRSEWNELILSELNANRPVLYGGRGSLGGHQFVLDGVDDNGRYHFNFGWNGSGDGYFELDAISPSIYNFSSNQSMILLVTKDVVGSPSDVFYSNFFTLSSSVDVGKTAKAKFNPICFSNRTNSQTVEFDGRYGIGVFDKEWNFVKSLYSSSCSLNSGYSYISNRNVDVRFDPSTFTENSGYYIALYAQSSNSEKPTPMRTSMGANDWYRAMTKNGVVTLDLLAIIPDGPDGPDGPDFKPLPLTGNLRVLALDRVGDYKIWDVSVIKDGTDTKTYWFKGFDQIVTGLGYTAEQNQNTVYGIYEDDGSFTIPVPQKMGDNLFLNNFSSDDGLNVVIAQDGASMKINETWGTVERKQSGDNTTQENVSVYSSATYYPQPPVPVETPVIVVGDNHKVSIACGTEGATIYYTLNGNTPTTSSPQYSGAFDIDRNLTIKAIAVTFDNANTSEVAQLTVDDFIVSLPTLSESNGEVTINCADADKIYYTTDTSTPTIGNGMVYTKPLKFDVTTTIKAIGVHEGWKDSDVASYEYIVIPDVVDIEVLNNVKGQLASRIPVDKKLTAKSLTITGELNGTDITVIREMLVDGNLEYLDIKGCTIKSGGDKYPYLSLYYETKDNEIGWCMFARAKKLKSIVLPDNTIKVCYNAFSECDFLKEITIPEGCMEIDQAFQSCDNLEIINLPNSLVSFASDNFSYCPYVKSINIGDCNPNYKSVDGVLYSKDEKTLIRFPNNKTRQYSIKNGTEVIGTYAFYCSGVENVNIPTSVVDIKGSAFYSSKNLKELVIPNSVKNIDADAFEYCSNLSSLILPSQISSIPSSCFLGCYSLISLRFTENIKSIAPTAFNYCYSLQRFEVDINNPYLCSDDGVVYSKDMKTLVRCPIALYSENFRIPEGVVSIADNAFMGCTNIEKFTLPLSVDSIGQHAFEDCSMSNIQLSENVKFVGYQALSSCDSLKTFVVPNSLNVIAQSMFIFDYALSYVKIHGDVTKIGSSAFRFCRELSSIECSIKDIENVEVGDLAFDAIPDDCTWYIPFGTEEKYKACSWWVPTWKIVPLHENLLVASNTSVEAGKTAVLSIELNNDDVIRMMQFELRLPEGVSVLYDDEEDDYAIELTDRATKRHSLQCAKLPNGNYQFVLSTMTLNNLNGHNGVIAYITIKAEDNVEIGEYEAYLSNTELTAVEEDGSLMAIRPNDSPFLVTIIDSEPCVPGDVNGDGNITITDAGLIVNYILGRPSDDFNDCAADVNRDGNITITDAGEIIRIILGGGNTGTRALRRFIQINQ